MTRCHVERYHSILNATTVYVLNYIAKHTICLFINDFIGFDFKSFRVKILNFLSLAPSIHFLALLLFKFVISHAWALQVFFTILVIHFHALILLFLALV